MGSVKLASLEETVHSGEQFLAQLRQTHEMNFKYLQNVTIESLNFNVYNPEGKDSKKFQREWKQSANFFTPIEPETGEENLEDSIDLEKVPKARLQTKEASTNSTDQPAKVGN
ncbi:hypothetical protein J1N35_000910 [Gossypium stocksii]|uniref:Uncharacterized protein n=1 Tax=Gossypium stocksii TaxID=47602 RepID=A0A9D3WHZ3_9ROSI|nr:hypothetical protein J1N35_000910 [Gossypium stocksii]